MLIITFQINAPLGCVPDVKEHLAMYLERFGDTKVISVKEHIPQQMSFGQDNHDQKNLQQKSTRY